VNGKNKILNDLDCLCYTKSEFKDLIECLKSGDDSLVHSYGCKLNDVLENYLPRDTIDIDYPRDEVAHNYLYNDNIKRFGMVFLYPKKSLPTFLNDDDPVVIAIVLWRIRSNK
jgi:hypothetical protein